MSSPLAITLDGTLYNVLVEFPTLKRKFEIAEGSNSGTSINGGIIRDILGTNYEYSMTVRANPAYPGDYDNFFEQVRNPVVSHTITLPYAQSTLSLTCYITDGEDTYQGYYNGYKRWDELTLTVKSTTPITTTTPVSADYNVFTLGRSY